MDRIAIRRAAAEAAHIRQAAMCWARDARSFETLKELLGDYFDPQRHRCGVDVAFAWSRISRNSRRRANRDVAGGR